MKIDSQAVERIIREVSATQILPYFRQLKPQDIEYKSADDPVTIADKKAESELSSRFLDLLPGSKVVGEEAFHSNRGLLDLFFGESPVWIIDPVDGTRNFAQGSSEFGVIVALAERNQTIAGWIYDPTSDEFLTVEKGAGAWHKGQKLKVRSPEPLTAMSGFLGERFLAEYEKAPPAFGPTFDVMRAGAHEYPRLLIDGPHFGKASLPQVHFRASLIGSKPWDDAAAVLMHAEAGGYSAFWNGEAYKPSVYGNGLALTPDKDSWMELRNWCASFATLPESGYV